MFPSNRFRAAVLGCLGVLVAAPPASAACGPDAPGTARTITLDPAKHSRFVGHEKSLGLRHKEVILTFDDGPLGGNTSSILTTLKKNCVKATFFYVGKMAVSQPALVRRVVREGHTLGHHTWNHNRMLNYSAERAGHFLDKGIATLDKIAYGETTGRARVPFFRYPYLARNARTDKVVASRGLIAFDANIDSRDWKLKSAGAIHDRIMRRLRQDGKGIVLMHDIHARTAKMLPRLLRSLKAEGYRIVHIVPKGRALPVADPMVVAAVAPSHAVKKAIQTSSAKNTKPETGKSNAGSRVADKPATPAKRLAVLKSAPQTPVRPTIPGVVQGTIQGTIRRDRNAVRSGIVTLSTPSHVASAGIAQLKTRAAKPKRKTVRVASIRAPKRKVRTAKRKTWKLRSSHWIIN